MTNWNNLRYTGFDNFSSIAVDTVNKLLYTSNGTTVLRWNPVAGTRTDIGSPTANPRLSVTFFKGAPYCIWFNTVALTAGVAKYTGSWGDVYTTGGTISDTSESPYIINEADGTLIALFMMIDDASGGYRVVYSGDGITWANGTLEGGQYGYAPPLATPSMVNYTFGFLPQQLAPAYFLGTDNPLLGGANCHIYVWGSGNWSKHVTNFCTNATAATTRIQSRGLDKWWRTVTGAPTYSDVLTGGWTTPPEDTIIFAAGQFNVSRTPGVRMAAQYLKWWDDPNLEWEDDALLEGWLSTYGPSRFVFRYNDNDAYMLTRSGSTNYLLNRSEDLAGPSWPPPSLTGRLWLYRGVKNSSGGYDWASRGIKT